MHRTVSCPWSHFHPYHYYRYLYSTIYMATNTTYTTVRFPTNASHGIAITLWCIILVGWVLNISGFSLDKEHFLKLFKPRSAIEPTAEEQLEANSVTLLQIKYSALLINLQELVKGLQKSGIKSRREEPRRNGFGRLMTVCSSVVGACCQVLLRLSKQRGNTCIGI